MFLSIKIASLRFGRDHYNGPLLLGWFVVGSTRSLVIPLPFVTHPVCRVKIQTYALAKLQTSSYLRSFGFF